MAPMWIAKEGGLFKKHGPDVKLVFITSGPIGTASVLSGETDLAIIGGFAPLRAMVGGARGLVIIGQSKYRITSKILAKKEIASVQELWTGDRQQSCRSLFSEWRKFLNPVFLQTH